MQFETNDWGNRTPRKVNVVRGTVAAIPAFSQMRSELLATKRTAPPHKFKKADDGEGGGVQDNLQNAKDGSRAFDPMLVQTTQPTSQDDSNIESDFSQLMSIQSP